MIQRIQSLYLFVASALMAVTLFAPLARFAGEGSEFRLYAFAFRSLDGAASQPTLYMGVLLAAACALPLVTLFLFRRRLLQIRLCVVEAVLLIGAAVMEGIYYYLGSRIFSVWSPTSRACMPPSRCRSSASSSCGWPPGPFSATRCSSGLPIASVRVGRSRFRGLFPCSETGPCLGRAFLFRCRNSGRAAFRVCRSPGRRSSGVGPGRAVGFFGFSPRLLSDFSLFACRGLFLS